MKAKFPILIAAGILFASVTKAQYSDHREGDRYHGEMNYHYGDRAGYDGGYDRRAGDDRRYRQDRRYYRVYRDDFYRDRFPYYRARPLFPPHPVIILGY